MTEVAGKTREGTQGTTAESLPAQAGVQEGRDRDARQRPARDEGLGSAWKHRWAGRHPRVAALIRRYGGKVQDGGA